MFDLGDGVVRHDIGRSVSVGHSEPGGLRREQRLVARGAVGQSEVGVKGHAGTRE